MSRARAFADQDTSIFEQSLTSNVGLAPILQLQNIFDDVQNKKLFSRILVRFGLSSLTSNIVSKTYPDPRSNSSVSAYLYMFNAPHGDEQAESFDIEMYPLTQTWDEGSGLDLDTLTETGYANAVSAQSTVPWSTTGGTYQVDASSATMHFNHGEEDLKLNITTLFNDWLNGASSNYGVILKMSTAQEAKTGSNSALNIYYKKFFGRETNTHKKPYIQLEWDGSIKDDRNAVEFDTTANLFFYNIKRGYLQDLNSTGDFPGYISISGLTGSSWSAIQTSLSAERKEKGVYRCNFTLPLSASIYSAFRDVWTLSASPSSTYTFNFSTTNPTSGFDNYVTSRYRVTLKNLKQEYEKGNEVRIRMHVKDESLTLTPLTAATTAISNFTIVDGSYEIRELDSDLIEQSEVPLSYDSNGNFFTINTNNLYIDQQYKIVFKFNVRGETIVFDRQDEWYFKVV